MSTAVKHEAPPLSWPSEVRDVDIVASCDLLVTRLLGVTVLAGDEASIAIVDLRAFRTALTDNAVHGRNWWRKFGRRLVSALKAALPDWYTQATQDDAEEEAMRSVRASRMFEGDDLVALALRVFPGAFTAPLGAKGDRGI